MQLFLKCIILFVALAIIFTLIGQLFIESSIPVPGTILFSAALSLIVTVLYGWIDGVYVHPSAG